MVVLLVAAFVVQCVCWALVGMGLRRVQDGEGPRTTDDGPQAPDGRPPTADRRPNSDASPHDATATSLAASPLPPGEGQGEGHLSIPISVIVAAHNEAERLPTLLDALAAQTHRPFEVVVVDDRSTDATAQRVTWRSQDFPVPLRLVTVAPGAPEAADRPPKKHALERGVEAATHPRLAFTDADGRPGPEWLATLAAWAVQDDGRRTTDDGPAKTEPPRLGHVVSEAGDLDDGAVLVGYGPMVREDGWLNRFARYETVQTAALAAASIGWGRPWHAVGRNLSYPADLLARLGGFAHSAGSLSGDDDLLVQEVARTKAAPVRYVWDVRAAVPSPAPGGWRAFWRQKRRHASAGSHYPLGVLLGLGLFHTSNLVLWVAAPVVHVALGTPIGWGLLAGKLILQRSVVGDALSGLGDEPDARLWHPVLDALSAVYHAVLAVLGALPTPTRW